MSEAGELLKTLERCRDFILRGKWQRHSQPEKRALLEVLNALLSSAAPESPRCPTCQVYPDAGHSCSAAPESTPAAPAMLVRDLEARIHFVMPYNLCPLCQCSIGHHRNDCRLGQLVRMAEGESTPTTREPRHVCGLTGFGQSPDDSCPACHEQALSAYAKACEKGAKS